MRFHSYSSAARQSAGAALLPALLLGLAFPLVGGCDQQVNIYRPAYNEVFQQNPASKVDILLVVDNSCSMYDEQEKLSSGFDAFIQYFELADVNYHIGVVTTDMEDPTQSGRLQGSPAFITPDTPEASAVFSNSVRVGTVGSGIEQGLKAAEQALSPTLAGGVNLGFLRTDADLSVIFVSDEEDGSSGPVSDYVNYFRTIKGERNRDAFNASALIGLVEGATSDCGRDPLDPNSGAVAAYRYEDVAAQTTGITRSICDDDFGPIITELGLNSSRLQDRFPLQREPDLDTLEIQLTDADGETRDITDDSDYPWTVASEVDVDDYEQWYLVFTSNFPPVNSQIVVRYETGTAANTEEG